MSLKFGAYWAERKCGKYVGKEFRRHLDINFINSVDHIG